MSRTNDEWINSTKSNGPQITYCLPFYHIVEPMRATVIGTPKISKEQALRDEIFPSGCTIHSEPDIGRSEYGCLSLLFP